MGVKILKMRRIDHVVLTVSDLDRSRRFYHEVFDMPVLDDQSTADCLTLRCGHQLIRLQTTDREALQAKQPTIGSADLCLVVGDAIDDVLHHLKSYYVNVVAGPAEKHGAEGKLTSIYLRDPDENLIELAFYDNK